MDSCTWDRDHEAGQVSKYDALLLGQLRTKQIAEQGLVQFNHPLSTRS